MPRCQWCDNLFEAKAPNHIYCSKQHQYLADKDRRTPGYLKRLQIRERNRRDLEPPEPYRSAFRALEKK